jgi:hypothetical protein
MQQLRQREMIFYQERQITIEPELHTEHGYRSGTSFQDFDIRPSHRFVTGVELRCRALRDLYVTTAQRTLTKSRRCSDWRGTQSARTSG